MPRILSNNKPRRYADHRTREARQWAEGYDDIAQRYPPRDGLARELTAMAADLLRDYADLRSAGRAAQRKNLSPIRKTTGLFLATLRLLGDGGNGQRQPEDLALMIQRAREEGTSDE